MPDTKIMDLIPETLKEKLIEEVVEILKDRQEVNKVVADFKKKVEPATQEEIASIVKNII